MSKTVTFRLDRETGRILKNLAQRENGSKTKAIKRALREHWERERANGEPTAWEVYSRMKIPRVHGPKRDRARHVSKLFREHLLAKKRSGTL